jgi:formyl-CoA transferase
MILTSFLASDGYFMVQVGRPHQFERFCEVIGHQEWLSDPTYARDNWLAILESHIRPAVEAWAADKKKRDICFLLAEGGVACAPVHHAEDVVNDEHVQRRNMLVEVPRTDGVEQPILVPGNPVKMSKVQEGPEERMPWVGEHTASILSTELGLAESDLVKLREQGIIN